MKKKIILSSVLAIVLCISLIAGATFALFTSEARINVAVTSGKVNLTATLTDLKTYSLGKDQANGAFELGGQATISDNGKGLELSKMVPGDKVTVTIDVENNSNVEVQYCVKLIGEGELFDALEAVATINGVDYSIGGIEYTCDWVSVDANTAINDIELSILMPYTVGNEYQGKDAGIEIQLIAIQGNAAGTLYVEGDEYATWDEAIAAAQAANTNVQISGTVELAVSDAALDLQGITIEGLDYATIVFVNAENTMVGLDSSVNNVNLKNLTVVDETYSVNGENSWTTTYLEFGGVNTFENVEFSDGVMFDGDNTAIGCTFIGHINDSSEYGNCAMYSAWVNSGKARFEGCDFVGTRAIKIHEENTDVESVVVNDCAFGPLSKKPGVVIGTVDATTVITVTNCTFTNVQAGDQGMYTYECDIDVATFNFTLDNNTVIND